MATKVFTTSPKVRASRLGSENNLVAAKNPVRPRKNTAEGGGGGDSAVFLQKIEAKPAALLIESRTKQKSFPFLLEEKIRRTQIKKSEENFFAWWRVPASGGGLASLVGGLLKECSNINQKTPPSPRNTAGLRRTQSAVA